MIKSYANKVTSFLFCNDYVDQNKYDYDMYSYGFEVLIASLVNIVATLAIGIIFNKLAYTIIFLICYCPLRQFAGGYHADNYRNCLITFICILLLTIMVANILDSMYFNYAIILFSIINFINISILAPIEHYNNPLTEVEKKRNKTSSRLIAFIATTFVIISSQFQATYEYTIYSSMALFWINIMMVIGFIKNRGKRI